MKNKRTCDYIAEAIQNEILSGRMEAGQPLRQEELSEEILKKYLICSEMWKRKH